MDDAVAALRAFNRFYTRFVGALDSHYMETDLSLVEARLLYEIATREKALAAELQSELGLDAGYASRLLRRFQLRGWMSRGRGEWGGEPRMCIRGSGWGGGGRVCGGGWQEGTEEAGGREGGVEG